MKRALLIFLGVFFAAFGAVSAQTVGTPVAVTTPPLAQAQVATSDERYRIGLQDVLNVEVFNQPKLTGRAQIRPDGTILLYRLEKPIVAVCKTEAELENDIQSAYNKSYLRDARVKVTVVEQKSQSISVIGAVERPGTYYVTRRVHLLEILAQAGGPNKEAGTRMLVARAGSRESCKADGAEPTYDQIAVVDFKIRDVQEGKQTFWMQPGDVVSILDADVVYVYGDVNKQGAYRVREPITLTQAIVSAEGLKPAAEKDSVRILRQKPGTAEREEFVFDLNQIDKGKIKDPFLEPNDIVAVSRDKTKAIFAGLINTIKGSIPGAVYRFP
jgi:polysaccharide biosynthesis/export protein